MFVKVCYVKGNVCAEFCGNRTKLLVTSYISYTYIWECMDLKKTIFLGSQNLKINVEIGRR